MLDHLVANEAAIARLVSCRLYLQIVAILECSSAARAAGKDLVGTNSEDEI